MRRPSVKVLGLKVVFGAASPFYYFRLWSCKPVQVYEWAEVIWRPWRDFMASMSNLLIRRKAGNLVCNLGFLSTMHGYTSLQLGKFSTKESFVDF
jgi:hypothetical protein